MKFLCLGHLIFFDLLICCHFGIKLLIFPHSNSRFQLIDSIFLWWKKVGSRKNDRIISDLRVCWSFSPGSIPEMDIFRDWYSKISMQWAWLFYIAHIAQPTSNSKMKFPNQNYILKFTSEPNKNFVILDFISHF